MMTHIQVCDKKTARRSGVRYFGLGMIAFAVMLSSVPAQAAKYLRSVERQCVIALVAPKEEGACKLGPDDPEAKVVLKGWYFPPVEYPFFGRDGLGNFSGKLSYLALFNIDSSVKDLLNKWEKKGLSAWQEGIGEDSEMSDTLDPDEGETALTDEYGAYTEAEAMQYMKKLFAWAHAWKKWRGKGFGK